MIRDQHAHYNRVYDSNPPPEPHYPAMKPSKAEAVSSPYDVQDEHEEKHRRDSGFAGDSSFAPPGLVIPYRVTDSSTNPLKPMLSWLEE